jgi:hypothetical protein
MILTTINVRIMINKITLAILINATSIVDRAVGEGPGDAVVFVATTVSCTSYVVPL